LQKYLDGKIKIIISPMGRDVHLLEVPIIGKVVLVGEKQLENYVVNLTELYESGYNYIILSPKGELAQTTLECLDNSNSKYTIAKWLADIYPSYIRGKPPFMISISKLMSVLGAKCHVVRIANVEEIKKAKTYYIDLYLRENSPGSVLVVHTYDYSFNGHSSFIEISNSSVLYYGNNASIISLFKVNYRTPRRQYFVYSEGTKNGTVFHIARVKNSDAFAIKGYRWWACKVRSSYSYSYIFALKEGDYIRLYSNGINSCSESVNITVNKQIIYSRIGVSQPFQETWLDGAVSWIVLYNKSLTVFEYEQARLGIFLSKNLLYFIEPICVHLFNYNFTFHNVSLIDSNIKTILELKGVQENITYISIAMPYTMSLYLTNNCKCRVLKTFSLANNLLKVYVVDIKSPYFLVMPDFNHGVVAITTLDISSK
ncbi:MAG: hypothetical protein DRG31_07880, partial [Deltaproteobacteria bacterium]